MGRYDGPYGCVSLDAIDELETVIVTRHGEPEEVSGEEAAAIIAGAVFDKYVNGASRAIRKSYDSHLGCHVIDSVIYPFGRIRFEYPHE